MILNRTFQCIHLVIGKESYFLFVADTVKAPRTSFLAHLGSHQGLPWSIPWPRTHAFLCLPPLALGMFFLHLGQNSSAGKFVLLGVMLNQGEMGVGGEILHFPCLSVERSEVYSTEPLRGLSRTEPPLLTVSWWTLCWFAPKYFSQSHIWEQPKLSHLYYLENNFSSENLSQCI